MSAFFAVFATVGEMHPLYLSSSPLSSKMKINPKFQVDTRAVIEGNSSVTHQDSLTLNGFPLTVWLFGYETGSKVSTMRHKWQKINKMIGYNPTFPTSPK